MAKLIFTSHYMKHALPSHLEHYVKYIATREGVDQIDDTKRLLDATENQKKMLQKMLKDFPEAKRLLEYEDYIAHPNRGNASALMEQITEQYIALSEKRENYVDYISNRPGVELYFGHGLFTDEGEPVVLSHMQKEVAEHQGVIWTHVVSLRREDAARLGYDNGRAWRDLLRSKRAMFAREMQINSKNLKWYAAFHNAGHHPHVHIMIYSKDTKEGYLTKKAIQNMRSELMHDIFRQEFLHIYEEQKVSREKLMIQTKSVLEHLNDQSQPRDIPKEFQDNMLLLAARLRKTSGKKVYGYLKQDVKRIVDTLVDQLGTMPEIQEAYAVWKEWQYAVDDMYGTKAREPLQLSCEKKLQVIKNMVIQSALEMNLSSELEASTGEKNIGKTHQELHCKETAILNAAKLVQDISRMFQAELSERYEKPNRIDSKRKRVLLEKRLALGEKEGFAIES